MTAIEPIPEPTTTTRPWNDLLDELKARYPRVREPIVAALAVLMQNPDIDVDHAKAVAAANGVRITAASVAGAQRLLARQDGAAAPKVPRTPKAAVMAATPQPGRVRRLRAAAKEVDAEALIKQVVGKIQDAGHAEAERLRDAIQKAIVVLRAATGS